MKDKLFLLNSKPFLFVNLKNISMDLKAKAKLFYDAKLNGISERNMRLNENDKYLQSSMSSSSRSLAELTNDQNIFYKLHSRFTWILLATAKTLSEEITYYNTSLLKTTKKSSSTIVNRFMNKKIQKDETSSNEKEIENILIIPTSSAVSCNWSFRDLKRIFKLNFIPLCYCVLTGNKINIKGPIENIQNILMHLKKILPIEMHKLLQLDVTLNSPTKTILSFNYGRDSSSSFTYEISLQNNENVITVKWPKETLLPKKLPNLLNKIIKTIDETQFNDIMLDKHLNVLINEWKYKIICLNHVKSSNEAKIKNILGIQQQDISLVNHWISFL